jgi:KUP system potassium uptake protein
MHSRHDAVPPAQLTNLRANDSLHETIVLLSIHVDDASHLPPAARAEVVHHPLGFHQLSLHYGFADRIDLSEDLAALLVDGVSFDPEHTTYFLGRERIEVTDRPGMASWREHLFAFMSRTSSDPTTHFGLPVEHSVDIGTHVDL